MFYQRKFFKEGNAGLFMLQTEVVKKFEKVLFIAPATEFGAYPPNGLLSIAGFLRREGLDVEIIDYSGEKIDKKRVINDIEKSDPDIVAISVLTGPGLSRGLLVSDVAKELEKVVIWGGPHVTILPRLTLQYHAVDYGVIGEGEYAILELIQYLNKEKNIMPNGIAYKKNGEIIINPPQTRFIDLEKKPLPAWDLISNIDKYFHYKKNNIIFIESHRGCPYRCAFCHHANDAVKDFGGTYRTLSARRIMEEFALIKSLTSKHVNRMDIAGDLQISGPGHAERFSKEIKEIGEDVRWWSVTRFHLLNEKAAEAMSKAGCESIMLGVESGSERIQRLNTKPVILDHAIKVTKALRKNGTFVTNTYMMGHPDETMDELKLTLEYMRKIPSDQNLLQIYRPFPGTPYWEFSVLNNKVKDPKTFDDFETFGVLTFHANISKIPSKKLLRTFYRVNLYEQTRFLINLERFYLRYGMYEQFRDTLINNRFTYKLKELARIRKEKKLNNEKNLSIEKALDNITPALEVN